MRHPIRLALLFLALVCATPALAAGPRAFDPDGPTTRSRTPKHPASPAPAPRPAAAPVVPSRTPASILRPAPSVGVEPPPPPGMGILRHMMRSTQLGSPLHSRRRSPLPPGPQDESWVL